MRILSQHVVHLLLARFIQKKINTKQNKRLSFLKLLPQNHKSAEYRVSSIFLALLVPFQLVGKHCYCE